MTSAEARAAILAAMPVGHVCACTDCAPGAFPPDTLPRIDERHYSMSLGDYGTRVYVNGVEHYACRQAYEGTNGEGWAFVVSMPAPFNTLPLRPHRCRCNAGKACCQVIFGDVRIEHAPH